MAQAVQTEQSAKQLYSSLKQAIESGNEAELDRETQSIYQRFSEGSESSARDVLFIAACDTQGGLPALRALTDCIGIDVFLLRDRSGDSVVHMVAEHQSSESMEFIKDAMHETHCFKSPNRDRRGGTVTHCAARNRHGNSTLQWLITELGPGCLTDTDADGNTPIHLAARHQTVQSMQLIKQLMDGVQCFSVKGFKNRTALHFAALNRENLSVFLWLVEEMEAGCVTEIDADQYTPMHIAAERLTAEAMQAIKAKTNDAECFKVRGCNRMTAAHSAAMNEVDSSSLQWLINELGHHVLMDTDGDGNTVAHLAAAFQTAESMRFIMKQRGSVDCFLTKGINRSTVAHCAAMNKFNSSALHWIVEELGPECLAVKDLLGNSVVHNAAGSHSADTMKLIKLKTKDNHFREFGENRMTPVHCAAFNTADASALMWLVKELGPDCLRDRDADGDTVIHVAAFHQSADCMQLIKDVMGDLKSFKQKGRYGMTVVHCAVQNRTGDSSFCWLVSELGPDSLKTRDNEGNTPIHDAAEFQTEETLEFIKEKMNGSDFFRHKGRDEMTAVHCAAMNKKNSGPFKWLVTELGTACLMDRTSDGSTPLHFAAEIQDVDVLQFIKESTNGIDCFKTKGRMGRTVVHSAAQTQRVSHLPLAWLVNELGPECLLYADERGDTVIHTAAEFQTKETLQLIKEKLPSVDYFRRLRGRNGMNAVHTAALNKVNRQTLRWLIKELGQDCVKDVNYLGNTVLDLCRLFEKQFKLNRRRKTVFVKLEESL